MKINLYLFENQRERNIKQLYELYETWIDYTLIISIALMNGILNKNVNKKNWFDITSMLPPFNTFSDIIKNDKYLFTICLCISI